MNALLVAIRANGGFMTLEQVDELAKLERLRQVLVRCGNGRFMCAADSVRHFTGIIEREGSDYVRDISLPTDTR